MDDDQKRRAGTAMTSAGLVILLERAGGELLFTEADYQAIAAKYGGPTRLNVRAEVLRQAGTSDTVRLRLERKDPRQGEIPS